MSCLTCHAIIRLVYADFTSLERLLVRMNLLLELSKGDARVEIPASFFFRSVANRSQVLITHA